MRRPANRTPDAPPALVAARALLAAELGVAEPAPDWDAIASVAESERLSAWLYGLGRLAQMPAPRLETFRRPWLAFQRQHLAGLHELGVLVAAFEAADIPVIPLKGPLLAIALYRDPAGRAFTDLDLLVPRARAGAAIDVLTGLGYRHLGHDRSLAYERAHAGAACFVPASSPHGIAVDLHWSMVSFPGGFVPRRFDDTGVWERATRAVRLQRPVLQLADDDLVLYLALHLAVHHPLGGLRWRLELAVCLGRLGHGLRWNDVARRARDWGVSAAVYFAFAATARSLGPAPPLDVMRAMRPTGWRGRWLDRLAADVGERPRLDYLVNLLSLDTAADRARLLRRALAPSASWVRTRYDAASAVEGWRHHYRGALRAFRRR